MAFRPCRQGPQGSCGSWVTSSKCVGVIFNINKYAPILVSPGSPCPPHQAARYETFMASGLSCRRGRKQDANCGFGDFRSLHRGNRTGGIHNQAGIHNHLDQVKGRWRGWGGRRQKKRGKGKRVETKTREREGGLEEEDGLSQSGEEEGEGRRETWGGGKAKEMGKREEENREAGEDEGWGETEKSRGEENEYQEAVK